MKTPRRRLRRWLLIAAAVLALLVVFVAGVNWSLLKKAEGKVFNDAGKLERRDVTVILGTSPIVAGKWLNQFFESRMDAAASLWKAEKTRHFIVSGDNSRKDYDEPTAMRDALVKRGVPISAITLDYAGFRTLDTMARARAVFGQQRVIVVTDDFHLPRSLFLAEAHGMDAIGFCGIPVTGEWTRRTRYREVLSRVAAWLDVYVLKTKPKFYGPPVAIPLGQSAG